MTPLFLLGAASITETSSQKVDSGQAGDTGWSETSLGVVTVRLLSLETGEMSDIVNSVSAYFLDSPADDHLP